MHTHRSWRLPFILLSVAAVHCDDGDTCVNDCTSDGGSGGAGPGGGTTNTGGEGATSTVGGGGAAGGNGGNRGGDGGAGGEAASGFDPSFGSNGIAITAMRDASDDLVDMVRQSDGKLVAVGTNWSHRDLLVYRFEDDGSADPSFGNGGAAIVPLGLEGRAVAVALQPDGKILVLGTSQNFMSGVLARFDIDGSLDLTWGTAGVVAISGRALAAQPDGKVLVAYGGAGGIGITRLTTNGAVDATFSGGGAWPTAVSPVPVGLAVDSNGRIVTVVDLSGQYLGIARFTSSGDLDVTFGGDGMVDTGLRRDWDRERPLALLPGDEIVIGGSASSGPPWSVIAKYDIAGALDLSFGVSGYAGTGGGGVEDIEVDETTSPPRIVVLRGSQGSANGVYRFDSVGVPDASFASDGSAMFAEGSHALVIRDDGGLVLAGADRTKPPVYVDSYFQPRLMGISADGELDASWALDGVARPHATASLDEVHALTVAPDGGVVAVGRANIGAAAWGFALVKYTAAGVLDASFGAGGRSFLDTPDVGAVARAVAIDSSGRIVVSGGDIRAARFTANGALDASFGMDGIAGWNGVSPYAMALDASDRMIIGGAAGTTSVLARATSDGALDTSFGEAGFVHSEPASLSGILALAVASDGKLLVTGVGAVGLLTRYEEDGGADATFAPTGGAAGVGRAIDLMPDGRIVVAGSSSVNPYSYALDDYKPSDLVVARFLDDGAPDPSFGTNGLLVAPSAGPAVTSPMATGVRATAEGFVYVAGIGMNGGAARGFILRLLEDGAVDTSFGASGVLLASDEPGRESGFFALARQPGGELLAGGFSYESPSGRDFLVARLLP